MPQEESAQSLEKEIQALEEKLAARKAAEERAEQTAPREEKEVFRDVLKEHVEQAKETAEQHSDQPAVSSGSVPQTAPYDYAAQTHGKAGDAREQEHRGQVEALIEIALTKGILDAVQVARHLGNPHILDDFHDMLIDEYYEKLVQARKISP